MRKRKKVVRTRTKRKGRIKIVRNGAKVEISGQRAKIRTRTEIDPKISQKIAEKDAEAAAASPGIDEAKIRKRTKIVAAETGIETETGTAGVALVDVVAARIRIENEIATERKIDEVGPRDAT